MAAHRKLTDVQIQFARQVMAKRREALRELEMYPTLAELAGQLGVTPRYLSDVVNDKARAVTCSQTGNILTHEVS